ncbi:hypothetical protein [Leptothermofonsia sp. ETS-13]|uniref:hypothetical protein n=1 Tax=Leptothermofonsia sp. ETS-13 TaxID=3035696 RepID=UPI003BA2B478
MKSTERMAPISTRLEPNLFELQGYDTQISFSASSIAGVPQFSYSDRVQTRTFSGDEILQEETGLGRMVTVQLQNKDADQGFETVTLLLPKVQLAADMNEVAIQTLAILNKRVEFVAPGAQQLQTYNPIFLSGTAKRVQF